MFTIIALLKPFIWKKALFGAPKSAKMETNKVITFAYLIIIALFYKQNPIAKTTLNGKVRQTGKL